MWKKISSVVATVFVFAHGSSALDYDKEKIVRRCSISLTLRLNNEKEILPFDNGSLFYEGNIYPREHWWWDNEMNSTLGCICNLGSRRCIRKCCTGDKKLFQDSICGDASEDDNRTEIHYKDGGRSLEINNLKIPEDNLAPDIKHVTNLQDHFYVLENQYCPNGLFSLEPETTIVDEFLIDYHGVLRTKGSLVIPPEDYCIDREINYGEKIRAVVCFAEKYAEESAPLEMKFYSVGMLVSLPFMIATFLVYAIIPELRNLYGKTLMCYVACLLYSYLALIPIQLGAITDLVSQRWICILIAFTIYFSFLASFFWLNVMCFDIWWTFGGFRSLQGSIRQRERKKFLMYSIYAWGCAIILTIVCIILDFTPGIPDDILRPEFGTERCWFKTETAKAVYFYGPMGVTVICNIILFISTATKIIQHKKDTAHHLKGMDSKRHDDNKQWFNLYLKLFIVMGINWSMEIISWLCQGPKYLWYLTDIANTLQGVIIFIIFVWKEKIKRLLIKRFGCNGPNFLSRESTRSGYLSSASRTCTTSFPLHEKTNTFPDPVYKIRPNSDDSDGA